MVLKSVTPFSGTRGLSSRAENDPFQEFRRDLNRMFDEFVRGFGMPHLVAMPQRTPQTMLTPRIDVSETDDEIRIAAELPGIDEDDVELTLAGDILTIRAAKTVERDDEEEDFHIVERSEGTFYRSLELPFAANPEQVEASFKDGILLIAIAKPQEGREKEHKIGVRRAGADDERRPVDRAAAGDKPLSAGEPGAAEAGNESPG